MYTYNLAMVVNATLRGSLANFVDLAHQKRKSVLGHFLRAVQQLVE